MLITVGLGLRPRVPDSKPQCFYPHQSHQLKEPHSTEGAGLTVLVSLLDGTNEGYDSLSTFSQGLAQHRWSLNDEWINKWPAGCPLCPPHPFACPERNYGGQHPRRSPTITLNRADLCNQQDITEVMECDFCG